MEIEQDPVNSGLVSSSELDQTMSETQKDAIPEPEPAPNNTDSTSDVHIPVTATPVKKRGKKRKSRIPKDATAPKQPLSGYIRFLNERRDQFRADHPGLGFTEVTRLMAAEWTNLPPDNKKQYLDAAEHDKERYGKEWEEYKKTESYKEFRRQQLEQKEQSQHKKKAVPAPPPPQPPPQPQAVQPPVPLPPQPAEASIAEVEYKHQECHPVAEKSATLPQNTPIIQHAPTVQNTTHIFDVWHSGETDIPIFTEQFLQHNKTRESELRQLRKAHADYEQQNAILQRHAEEVGVARSRLLAEAQVAEQRAAALAEHQRALVTALVKALKSVSLPGSFKGAREDNIEQYMEKLRELANEGRVNASVRQAREILLSLKLPS